MTDASGAVGLARERETRFGVVHCKDFGGLCGGPVVLHCDYNGWWAPLQELHYSDTSRCLVSRHPLSCAEELVSYYCPQCLSRYLEDEVQQYCHRCPTCVLCPMCHATTRIEALSRDSCAYKCGFCEWNSEVCALTASSKSQLETALRVKEVEGVAEEAFRVLKETLVAQDKEVMASVALESASPFKSPLRQRRAASLHQLKFSDNPVPAAPERRRAHWKWEDLNAKLESKQKENNTAESSFLPANVRLPTEEAAHLISSVVEDCRRAIEQSDAVTQTPTLQQRLAQAQSTPYTNSHLLPVRVTLRHKLTRRCRKDKDAEKMSILSQPKSLPMEGDSSLLKDAGRWFYKNSSAVGMCPRIIITQLPFASEFAGQGRSKIHFTIYNPFHHHEMKIRLLPSNGMEETKQDGEDAQLSELRPPFSEEHSLRLVPLIPTDVVEFTLAIAEDDFLRDDKGSDATVTQQQLPTNDHGFLIEVKHHMATVVVPLQLPDDNRAITGKVHVFPFHLSVQQLGVDPEEAVKLHPMHTLIAYELQQ